MQSYTIAGDILPREPLMGVIGNFLTELNQCKNDASGKAC
jgi:hypothetical protein